MNRVYFVVTHNENPVYTNIWDLQKRILNFYNINYIEGVVTDKVKEPFYHYSNENLIMNLKSYSSRGNLCKYFMLMLYRWYIATYECINDDDVFIIFDCDQVEMDPKRVIDLTLPILKENPTKILSTHAYTRTPRRRFCSTYQIFYASTIKELFKNKTPNDCINEAVIQGESIIGINNNDEFYLGQKYFDNNLCMYLDWDDPEKGLNKLLDIQVILDDKEYPNLDLLDWSFIHGYVGMELQPLYLERLKSLLNKYYKNKQINLVL